MMGGDCVSTREGEYLHEFGQGDCAAMLEVVSWNIP